MAEFGIERLNFVEMVELVKKIGDRLTNEEVKLLKFLAGDQINRNSNGRIVNGRDFLLAMVKVGTLDETNFESITKCLKCIHRHDLIHLLTTKENVSVPVDPVEEYFQQVSNNLILGASSSNDCRLYENRRKAAGLLNSGAESQPAEPPLKRRRIGRRRNVREDSSGNFVASKQYTCNIRLQVKVEYFSHEGVLEDRVNSTKVDPLERQLDIFNQSSLFLQSRDLGCVVCDIKFSDLSYLESFWADYLNGSLAEGLKGAFITESLRQAVNNEDLKLMIYVNEKDYEEGRRILLKNLTQANRK